MRIEHALISKLKNGDKKSFEKLFLELYTSLCEYSASITASGEIAEEIVQDVFTHIWQNRATLGCDINIKAYLFKSVKNRSLDFQKYENTRHKYQNEVKRYFEEIAETDESAIDSRLTHLVQKEIEKLPNQCKTVFQLHRRDGLTYNEIAQVLEISVKSVEAYMTKSLKILRTKLSKKASLVMVLLISIFL